ncbi:uncharacterized protein LOC142901470 [Nelusetta ayraudi]|uniref:uncharacterized protein LOC142901470 n=1 Tax=Nelusetta ayraudi TaxID=303726 RepID=UPI003F6F4F2D
MGGGAKEEEAEPVEGVDHCRQQVISGERESIERGDADRERERERERGGHRWRGHNRCDDNDDNDDESTEGGPVGPRPPLTSDLRPLSCPRLAIMSQPGKVLHLYVEVRSVADDDRKQQVGFGGPGGRCELMPPCQEASPRSQRSSVYSSPNRSPSPGPPLINSSSPPSSKSSSRHSVSFQLHSPEGAESPQPRPHDLLSDGFSQLLQALAPHDTLDVAPFKAGSPNPPSGSAPCARLTVPPTGPAPHHHSKSPWAEDGTDADGRTSVVTYGYIEKSNVYSRGRRSSACHGQLDGTDMRRPEGALLPTQAHKRLSDPLWYNLHPCHTHPHLGHAAPHLQRVTLDAAARDATYRALEEFGSPDLRRRFSGQGAATCSPTLPRSWGAPPAPPPRSTYTLPPRVQLSRVAVNGLPRSPASDHLCSHTGYPTHALAPPPGAAYHSQPRLWAEDGGLRLQQHLPAGRPTDIQHHVRYNAVDVPPARSHISSPRCSSRTRARSMSPSFNPDVAAQLAAEASRLSSSFAERRTPSPAESWRSDSPRAAEPIQRESQPYATLHGRRSPEHLAGRYSTLQNPSWSRRDPETPQTRPGRISPASSRRTFTVPASPALPAQLHRSGASQNSPVLDPRRQQQQQQQQQGPEATSRVVSSLHRYQQPQYTGDRSLSCEKPSEGAADWSCMQHQQGAQSRLTPPSSDQWNRKQSRGSQEQPQGSQGPTGNTGSTGSTGSLLSPHSVSQCGHGTPSSAAKSDGGATVVAPPTRSQKIARAKWEFLFGGPAGESRSRRDAPRLAPAPTGTPPSLRADSSQRRRGPDSPGQRSSAHQVRQVEVELVTSGPRGSTPRTGIIRHSVKYSETDLDAVPLRCYRETDLDEVMRAEAEAAEQEQEEEEELEEDSAFGSNRSSSLGHAPTTVAPWGVEPEEEEGVASWASVRMLGERQRRRAEKEQEQEEVLGLLLRGPSDPGSAHGGLKSPISLGSPRRPSDCHLDSFSRHFESILESQRAKGTSYSSLDSVDLLTSGSNSVFTFDLPTLTPEIQSQICDSAKQILELSFAPLAHPDPCTPPETSRSEMSLSSSGAGLRGGSKDDGATHHRSRSERETWRRSILKDGFRKATSVPALHSSPRERPVYRPPELLYPQADVAQRLALGGSDEALTNGMTADLQAARRLAKRLYNLDGFRKSDVARHLSKNNEFSQMVAEEYLNNFNFSRLSLDQALRKFLEKFSLSGETQERERVLVQFSRKYRQSQPESETTEDSVHTLTCAVMLLNTDLHGNNVGKRMSCSQFITNLEGLNDGKDFPKDLLKTLYSSIKNEKLQWTIDEEELRKSMSELTDARTDSASHTMKRLGNAGNPLVSAALQADGELYKSGFLVRKVHADPDGKRTPRGRRGWKSFYAMLKGLVLYLQKDEYRTERELTEEDVKNAVSVHHSLAMRAADYSKRPNVFYLRTADWRVFLFQAPNGEQMQSWITRINVVAAASSAPPFPAAIGSQKRFSRPLLPGSSTKLSQEEQVKSHEGRFRAVSSELAELVAATPERKVKGRELDELKLRREYLEFEKTRYGTYAMLLRARLAGGDQDLSAFEARLLEEGGGGLQRAHSSPTLPQDTTVAAKEKTRGSKTSKSLKVSSTASLGGRRRKDEGGKEAELHRESSRQEEAA